METLFLLLIVCIDGAPCRDAQVFTMDSFSGAAAVSDCEARRIVVSGNAAKAGLPNTRLICKTAAQFDRMGVTL